MIFCFFFLIETLHRFNIYMTSIRRRRRPIDVLYTLKSRNVSIRFKASCITENVRLTTYVYFSPNLSLNKAFFMKYLLLVRLSLNL